MSIKRKLISIIIAVITITSVGAFSVSAKEEYTILTVTLMQKHIGKVIVLPPELQQEYDFDKNGKLNILDCVYLQKVIAKVIDEDITSSSTKPTVYPTLLQLNKTVINLGVSEQYRLSIQTDLEDFPFIFTSSNEEVATVMDDGTIIAKSIGATTIICSDGNELNASCVVKVGNMADSVTLNKASVTLGVDEQFDLNSYIPNGTVAYHRAYSSDNEAVAIVKKSGGLITAKSIGTAVITCKLYNGETATCNVTVKSAPLSVKLNKSNKTLKVGQNFTLSAHSNSGAYCNPIHITWNSSNTKVARIVKGSSNKAVIQPYMQGTATITCRLYNGKVATCKVVVSGTQVKCIDISTWQNDVDFKKIKSAGYSYVIIRAGYGDKSSQKDNMFESHYKNAKAAGLKVGAYWFSYAMSPSEAIEEAKACLSCIKGKTFDMPIYYDLEYVPPILNLSKTTYTKMATNFCNKIVNGGYRSGVYASASVFGGYPLDYDTLIKNNISIWNAEWNDKCTVKCDIWQYSETGKINGINTYVDLNYIYNLNIVS